MEQARHHQELESNELLTTTRKNVDDMADEQAALARRREDLLIERSKVTSTASKVRKQRTITANAEVQFIDLLRQHYQSNGEKFPVEISVAYERVMEERDVLGSSEEEHLQAERALGGSEWTFMQTENMFYQFQLKDMFAPQEQNTMGHIPQENVAPPMQPPILLPPLPPPPHPFFPEDASAIIVNQSLPPPPPPPPPPPQFSPPSYLQTGGKLLPPAPPLLSSSVHPSRSDIDQQYQAAKHELGSLRKEFDALRSWRSELLDLSHPGGVKQLKEPFDDLSSEELSEFETSSELLGKIAETEVKMQNLKQAAMQCDNFNILLDRRMSDPIHPAGELSQPFDTITRAHTDGALPTTLENPNVKFRIRDWLWECMRNKAIERTIYLNILAAVGIPELNLEHWEDCAADDWPLGSNEDSVASKYDPRSPTEIDPEDLRSGSFQDSQKISSPVCNEESPTTNFEQGNILIFDSNSPNTPAICIESVLASVGDNSQAATAERTRTSLSPEGTQFLEPVSGMGNAISLPERKPGGSITSSNRDLSTDRSTSVTSRTSHASPRSLSPCSPDGGRSTDDDMRNNHLDPNIPVHSPHPNHSAEGTSDRSNTCAFPNSMGRKGEQQMEERLSKPRETRILNSRTEACESTVTRNGYPWNPPLPDHTYDRPARTKYRASSHGSFDTLSNQSRVHSHSRTRSIPR